MDLLIIITPVVILGAHCLISGCLFRRLSSRIQSLEERIITLSVPNYPPPPPLYPQPPYYTTPPGYGYTYSGQGNLNVI